MVILDGKKLSEKIKLDLKYEVDLIKSEDKRVPHLVAILIGQNPASHTYVNAKKKACEEIGFESTILKLPEIISQEELLKEEFLPKLNTIKSLAEQLGVSMAQLSIAWCLKNENVSSVILGASKKVQLKENLDSLKVYDMLDEEMMHILNT